MTWFKSDVRLQCSPRLRAVGSSHGLPAQQRATLLWHAVLAVNAEHDCDGKLASIYADAGYLATFAPSLNAIEFRAGLEHLAVVGLIVLEGDGSITLPGWDETWRCVKTSTARVRLHRQLKAEREGKPPAGPRGRGEGVA
ncbi:MAG: hypothetical protein JNK15_03030 [Planctomycetes bacterium]|nr:hypothetical protein [Planctomycetota bacterium]